jgi:hypothetical protein
MSKRARAARAAPTPTAASLDPTKDPRLTRMNPAAPPGRPGIVYSVVLDTGTGRGQGTIGVQGPDAFENFMHDVVLPIAKQLGFEMTWKRVAGAEGQTPVAAL